MAGEEEEESKPDARCDGTSHPFRSPPENSTYNKASTLGPHTLMHVGDPPLRELRPYTWQEGEAATESAQGSFRAHGGSSRKGKFPTAITKEGLRVLTNFRLQFQGEQMSFNIKVTKPGLPRTSGSFCTSGSEWNTFPSHSYSHPYIW